MRIAYLFFLTIFPFLFIPSAYAATTIEISSQDAENIYSFAGIADGQNCGAVNSGNDPGTIQIGSDASNFCYVAAFQFDISGIPNWAEIAKVELEADYTALSGFDETCDIVPLNFDVTTSSITNTWNSIRANSNSTAYVDNDGSCNVTASDVRIDLTNQAVNDLQGNLTGNDLFTVGWIEDKGQGAGVNERSQMSSVSLFVTYSDQAFAVRDLVVSDVRGTGVDLTWSTPSSNLTITGYQINYTTPWSDNVATIGRNDTESSSTAATINELTGETQYSFRVGVYTSGGLNATGNVANTTTLFDPTKAWTPGTFNITIVGDDIRDIRFEEISINADDRRLNVTFPTTANDFRCDLGYQFLGTNRTYTNLDSNDLGDGFNETSFRFDDFDNEIITVTCWDGTTLNGTYIMTQQSIPLVLQIKQFQSGDFGTSGDFGAIDLISLIAFGVIATIGFNRNNEAVGAIFLFFLTFGLAWFEIITIPTAMGGIIGVVILLVVAQVRKN